MRKLLLLLLVLKWFGELAGQPSSAVEAPKTEAEITAVLEKKLKNADEEKIKLVTLNYKDVPIINIINELAAKLGINILLPQGSQAITSKITINDNQKISLKEAWKKVSSFLEILGYTWIPQNEYLALKKVSPDTTRREGLPLYVDVPVKDLPDDSNVIQAIFYLANIKINDPDNPITALLNDSQTGMLSKDAFVQADEKTNALIIVDRANTIKAAMAIIKELDFEGIPDAIEVIPLYYTDANFVQTLFKELIIAPEQPQVAVARKGSQQQAAYFPPNTKIMALGRTNSIVIMGSVKAIHIVRDFIIKYIDHPLESGRSILHIYNLQYLEAQAFAGVLSNLINPSQTGQSESQATGGGPKREFQDVIIVAELTSATTPITPSSVKGQTNQIAAPSQGVQQGGNRLIIAARDHDWQRIKRLIQELDIPQPQVVLEVLIVDLVLQRTRELGTQVRNPVGLNDGTTPNLNFQSGQLGIPGVSGIILKNPVPVNDDSNFQTTSFFDANALMANLLQFFPSDSGTNIANVSTPGSVVISLQDPGQSGTWLILRALSQYTNASVMSQPFIVTTNNKQATISSAETRLLQAGANSEGGAIKSNTAWVAAPITIDIVPRISKIANTINLQVSVDVEEYVSNQQNTRVTRQVQTNANVFSGEILAIGGLMRERDDIQESKVPLLGDVPLVGWVFKRKIKVRSKTNLMVFITPRIIIPSKNVTVGQFSSEKLCIAQDDMGDEYENLSQFRDPITRWFFKPDTNNPARTIGGFVEGKIANHNDITNETVIAKNNIVTISPTQVIANKTAPVKSFAKDLQTKKEKIVIADNEQQNRYKSKQQQLQALIKEDENVILIGNKVRS